MSKLRPNGKEILSQRDREIFELINLLIAKGYTASKVYEKLRLVTGLEVSTITYIRFKELKKLNRNTPAQSTNNS